MPATDPPAADGLAPAAGPQRRLRILLLAEAVTLAHVARPVALARRLVPAGHTMVLACAARYAGFARSADWQAADLDSIPSEQFARALAQGAPLYDLATLQGYVQADLALIQAHRPDVVVGDFRLSMSVSARLAGVPCLSIANAYWTPHAPARFPLPVLPLTRVLPLALARPLFNLFRPLAFAQHCGPMNRLRARHGLPGLGHDLRRVYTDADHLLVADDPALHPLLAARDDVSVIGPLAWSPDLPWPVQPASAPGLAGMADSADRPMVYVALGSSGPADALASVLAALADLPVQVMATTAGRPAPAQVPANAQVHDYLPGDRAAARAALVVCNGGSLAVQQALAAGVPVLGVASNMDQFLNMGPVVDAGAGRLIRADRLSVAALRAACQGLLNAPEARLAAQRLQAGMRGLPDPAQVFEAAVRRLLG